MISVIDSISSVSPTDDSGQRDFPLILALSNENRPSTIHLSYPVIDVAGKTGDSERIDGDI